MMHREEDQRRIADAGQPAAGHEGVQIGVVGVLGEIAVELQRADAERQIERHLGAEDMPAEPAEAALVIALVEAGALLEHLARSESNDSSTAISTAASDDGDHRHHDDARALRVASGWSAPSAPA